MTEVNETVGFPRDLLNATPEERFAYYKACTIAHPILQLAFDLVWDHIHEPAGHPIVMVVGPPRSGKTFLFEWLISEIKYEWAQQQSSDPGRIPVVGLEIPGRDTLKPAWSLLYERILRALEEPLIDKKIIYGDVALRPNGNGKISFGERVTGGKMRIAVEEALKHRRPLAVLMDEIHHLLGMAGLSFQDQMDCVKSLANMGGTLLVLFGTYEALDLIGLSDQLTFRTKVVHLRRYTETDEDTANFEGAINTFQLEMPFRKEPDLLKHYDYIYERTLGRVGVLRNWLLQAYRLALKEAAPTLTLKHLKERAPLSATQAQTWLKNIEVNEKEFYEKVGEHDTITAEDDADAEAAVEEVATASDSTDNDLPKLKPRRRSGRVGQRGPARDKTGRKKRAA